MAPSQRGFQDFIQHQEHAAMNTYRATNTTRFVTLAAALLVTAVEWTAFSEVLLLVDPAQIASAPVADASPDGALPEVIITAHKPRS
jgi:hypothetical protein